MMLTAQHIVDTFQRYVEFLTAGEVEKVVNLYAPDAVIVDPIGSEPMRGHEAIRAFYTSVVPQLERIMLDGNPRVHEHWGAAPLRCIPKQPPGFAVEIVDIMTFNEAGKVTSMTAYWGQTNFRPTT